MQNIDFLCRRPQADGTSSAVTNNLFCILRPGVGSKADMTWIKSRHDDVSARCLLYPHKQTLELSLEMSALCQKRTSEHVRVMSALPPKADIAESECNVRYVPSGHQFGLEVEGASTL